MPSSSSEALVRAAWFSLITIPGWACATAIDNTAPESQLSRSETAGAGSTSGDGSAGTSSLSGAAGSGAGGSVASGGAPSNGNGGAGKGGTSGSANTGGTAGKGGASGAGTSSGGTNNAGGAGKGGTAGKGGASGGTSSGGTGGGSAGRGGTSSGGANQAGANNAGSGSGATCDAAHAVATLTTSQVYTGKANDCVRLAVNPTWSTIALQFQPLPGTQGYPVPFSFFSCGGNGTGSLTADYMNTTFKSGPNPGCDFFVQFGGGETTIKVTYYD